ncbi:MAG: DsbA family protein [Kineosporiaceae bacterium]
MRRPPGPPRWYVSLRSPYSWLALEDGARHHADFLSACTMRMFFEPDERGAAALRAAGGDFPYVAMSKAKHLYILRDVARLCRARGLTPTWPVDRDPVWEVPSLAVLAAGADSSESFRTLAVSLTRARWQDGRDITDRAVVAAVAGECGLDPSLAEACEHPRWREAGTAALLDVQRDGVFGVPMFTVAREPFWGLDRLSTAAAAWRAQRPEPAVTPGPDPSGEEPATGPGTVSVGADAGHAGGCG